MSSFLSIKSLLIIILIVIVANLGLLDYLLFQNKDFITGEKLLNQKLEINDDIDLANDISSKTCPTDCVNKIKEATSSIVQNLLTPAPVVSTNVVKEQSFPLKEIFIAFGGGDIVDIGDWTDVKGLTSYVDSTKYGRIKSAVFEATVSIPAANDKIFVRLYNVTDKHPVWFTEMSHDGSDVKLLVSDPITLDAGNKQYQVQTKTVFKRKATLHQARLRITLE